MLIKVKYDVRERHVHARIFMGPETHQVSLCGNLMFSPEEFKVFTQCLESGSMLVKGAHVMITDAADGSSSSYPRVQLPPEA